MQKVTLTLHYPLRCEDGQGLPYNKTDLKMVYFSEELF